MKKYAKRSEAKKKYIKIKRGPKKLNFGASKPGVRGGPGPPLDPLVDMNLFNVFCFSNACRKHSILVNLYMVND